MSDSTVLAKGVVSNVSKYKPAGKGYEVADFTVEDTISGEPITFKKVYKGARAVEDGVTVEVTETQNGKFTDTSVEVTKGGSSKAASQPKRAFGGSGGGFKADPDKDERITRMACMNSANALMATLVNAGSLGKGVMAKPDLMFKTMGKYATLFYQAAMDGEFFSQLPNFEGNVNEVGEDDKPAKKQAAGPDDE